jgi:hypothetical protein
MEEMTTQAVKELGIAAEVSKITDIGEIADARPYREREGQTFGQTAPEPGKGEGTDQGGDVA